MTTRRESLCKTKGCPTRRKDFQGDVNDWHIPWCQHIKGHKCFGGATHQHIPKKGMGGNNPESKIVACLCTGIHDRIDNGDWGNEVLDVPEVGKVYRVHDLHNKTLLERVIEASPGPEEKLPAVMDGPSAREQLAVASAKGRQALELASNVGEVKDIRDQAEALRMYAQAVHLGLGAQNEMADIKIRAERKGGHLLPETIQHGGDATLRDVRLLDLGISEVQSHRWQKMADIPDLEYEAYAQTCMEEELELTSAGVLRLAYGLAHVGYATGENEWFTPPEYTEAARTVMGGIDLDPASCEKANEIVQATTFYSAEDDGLVQPWFGRVWMNPPYSQPLVVEFAEKLIRTFNAGDVKEACVLVNNATETAWFQVMLVVSSAACFIRGRVRFLDETGHATGAPLQGQAVLYFGNNVSLFAKTFSAFGIVMQHLDG